ncbi:MAG TPA: hypothetical protein VD699_03030 [Nitrosopumilaceae archaeon]|nr:hypothetical protein [Nitrosopumilaceae archaeon]
MADQHMTTKYPDFRFLCTSCGSLEVFVSRTLDTSLPQIHCLDCGKNSPHLDRIGDIIKTNYKEK